MKALEEAILREGTVLPGNIIKVDRIINHRVDSTLMMEMGQDIYRVFKGDDVDVILTLEVSGIALAMATAVYFKKPMIFAKKSVSLTLSEEVYRSTVFSHTKRQEFKVLVDKKLLKAGDKVLLVDDFLAMGEALRGLVEILEQAGAELVGVGIGIEKVFQKGGDFLREKGIKIHSLARIASLENEQVVFEKEEAH